MNRASSRGFTIVELMVIIAAIAILVTIGAVSYRGVTLQAHDTTRINDIEKIQDMLAIYKMDNGEFPAAVGNSAAGGWEVSTDGAFLQALVDANVTKEVPVDPVNELTTNPDAPMSYGNKTYFYHRYAAGSYGADTTKGRYYVLGARTLESVSGVHPKSPGFSLPGRTWTEGAYVVGAFENE